MIDFYIGDGKYHIYTFDKLNIALAEVHMIENPKSKRVGEVVEHNIGYYGSLEAALRAYKKAAYMSEDAKTGSVAGVTRLLKKIDESIKGVCLCEGKGSYCKRKTADENSDGGSGQAG